jgi:hypothetical protein
MTIKTDETEIDRPIPTGEYCRYCDNLAVHAFTIYCEVGRTKTGYQCQECLDEVMEQARLEYRDKKGE